MLTKTEALYYEEQLHPAFAGYLHDGNISQRDALSAVFHLLSKGILIPIWEENNMLKKIVGINKSDRIPLLAFDRILVEELFKNGDTITSKELGRLIKEEIVQNQIRKNLSAIEAFPIIRENLQFSFNKHSKMRFVLNGELVDTFPEAQKLKMFINKLFLPLFMGLGSLFILIYILNTFFEENGGSGHAFLFGGLIFILVSSFLFVSFTYSDKKITYDFKNDVVPTAKIKYDELFEFIKAHPLPKHRFINEFLAFSIAFGIDDSWFNDFGLEKEVQISKT